MHCNFEPELKWDCIKSVIDIARAGEVGNGQIAEAIEHIACFGGCAAALWRDINNDDDEDIFSGGQVLMAASSNRTLDEICADLEDCCPTGEEATMQAVGAIDWRLVWQSVWPLLLELFRKLLEKKS